MNLSKKINKIKIILFGNIWIARIVKWILYSSVILVAWLIGKSENLFPGESTTPWTVFKATWRWEDRTLDHWLSGFLPLCFFILLVFAYFWILSIFVEWLTRVEISPQQQIKIIEKKTYELDEKLNYKVEKINNLEATVFRGSPYVSLTGNLLLSNEKQKKIIKFICHSHSSVINPYLSPSSLETYFPQTKVEFKQKTFFTWQKIVGIILLVAGATFVKQVYKDAQEYKEQNLGAVVKSKGAIQKQLADQQKRKNEEEERQRKLKEAKITDPKDIRGGFEYIGGLTDAKKQCENNANAILEKNKNPKSLAKPQHMLLYGPPGTGKTFLAQAIAKKSGSFFLNLNGKDFQTSVAQMLGNEKGMSPENKIKRTFDIAIQLAGEDKTIVALIDEIDQMGYWGEAGEELLSILSGATSDRYKNIVIIATTNHIRKLSSALLRSGRIGRKLLINYPGKKDLRSIINKVVGEFCDEISKQEGGLKAMGGNKNAFKNEFSNLLHEEVKKDNYAFTMKDIFAQNLPEKLDPDEKKTLFTGADIKTILYESLRVMDEFGQEALSKKHVVEAVKRIFQDNMANPDWLEIARIFVAEEYKNQLDLEDRRKLWESQQTGGGPRFPRG